MPDSPLSVTASIAGILTFAAAILASIYVRYNSLRNAEKEIINTLESVSVTLNEIQPIAHAGSTDPDEVVHKMVSDLYSTEIEILARCMLALCGTSPSEMEATAYMTQLLGHHIVTLNNENLRVVLQRLREIFPAEGGTYNNHERRLIQMLSRQILEDESIIWRPLRIFLARGILFVFHFGTPPKLIRWYWV